MANVSGSELSQVLASSSGEVLKTAVAGELTDESLASSDGGRASSAKSGVATNDTYPRRVIIVPLEQGD